MSTTDSAGQSCMHLQALYGIRGSGNGRNVTGVPILAPPFCAHCLCANLELEFDGG